jgi:hypothetical protein
MPHPTTQSEILAALAANARSIVEYFSSVPDRQFFGGDPEHWDPAHHLVHLTVSNLAVVRALNSGKLPPHALVQSRTYAEVRDAATASLGAAPKEKLLDMGRTVTLTPGLGRTDIVDAFATSSAALRDAAAKWTEEAMDRSVIPHPLMGPLTVREMLLFFVVHERHHVRVVRERLEAERPEEDRADG